MSRWLAPAFVLGLLVAGSCVYEPLPEDHWTQSAGSYNQHMSGVSFSSALSGYVVGDNYGISSSDGGWTWNWLGGSSSGGYCIDALDNMVAVSGYYGRVNLTSDGGITWTSRYLPSEYSSVIVNSVDFQTTLHGCAVGERYAFVTSDGGQSWNVYTCPIEGIVLNSVRFDTGFQSGIAVGSSGTLVQSADGGGSWQVVDGGTESSLYGVCFISDSEVLSVGDGGTVLRSTDSGSNWTIIDSGVFSDLRSVDSDGSTAVAVGLGGTVIVSLDSGQTWSRADVPQSYDLEGVAVCSENHFVVVGESIFVTDDSGGLD